MSRLAPAMNLVCRATQTSAFAASMARDTESVGELRGPSCTVCVHGLPIAPARVSSLAQALAWVLEAHQKDGIESYFRK